MSNAPGSAAGFHDRTLQTLGRNLGEGVYTTSRFRDNLRVFTAPSRLIDVLEALEGECELRYLAELGATDYLGYPGWTRSRFEVHYVLRTLDQAEFLVVKTGVDDPKPTIPSATKIWPGADWMEREVYDMYGIVFNGHADLRRILMPDEFTAYPLRKDYPLRGRGERHNFPRMSRNES